MNAGVVMGIILVLFSIFGAILDNEKNQREADKLAKKMMVESGLMIYCPLDGVIRVKEECENE
jgi:cytochrome c biogenesis protein ResB